MLLELCPPQGNAPSSSFRLHLAFGELNHGLPSPAAWVAQLHTIANITSELDGPFNMHLLDKAVGLGTLLEGVRVEPFRTDASSTLGVRVQCTFVDSRVVEWCIPSTSAQDVLDDESGRLLRALENILLDINSMGLEEQKRKMAVQYEEQRQTQFDGQQQSRHQHAQSFDPLSLGRKSTHKRQKSFLQSIVSAVGSMMTSSQRSSPTHSRANSQGPILPTSFSPNSYPADYPFPVSPSPSPPLSPSHSPSPSPNGPSRSGTPSPEVASSSSCISVVPQHGHTTYTYDAHYHPALPPNPWTTSSQQPSPPPSTPLVPDMPFPSSSSQHQARMKEIRARIRTSLIDVYRRFVLGALVFGFAKEAGLISDGSVSHDLTFSPGSSGSETLVASSFQSLSTSTSTSPVVPATGPSTCSSGAPLDLLYFNPHANPPRSSNFSQHTYSYHLWLLRSMLQSAEEEVREIVEACEVSVREDFVKAAQAEFEVDVVDVDMTVDVNRSWSQQGRPAYSKDVPTSPTAVSPNFKVSFESAKSGGGGSPTKARSRANSNSGNGNEKGLNLTKKKSRGKLVKKRSVVGLNGEGEKEGKEAQRSKGLAIIGSWGKSKVSSSSPPSKPPSAVTPAGLNTALAFDGVADHLIEKQPSAESAVEDQGGAGTVIEAGVSPLESVPELEERAATPLDSLEIGQTDDGTSIGEDEDHASSMSHGTIPESSSGCGSSLESTSTGLTTPSGSNALSRCGSVGECELEEDDIGVAITTDTLVDASTVLSPRGSFEEEDALREAQHRESHSHKVYGTFSRSTGNLFDEPNPAAMSSSSLFLSNDSADNILNLSQPSLLVPNDTSSIIIPASKVLDTSAPDFQLQLRIRLNLHPAYTRLTRRVGMLRDLLTEAEEEKKEKREEELRLLDMLEVRSRRRAWSAGVLKQATAGIGGLRRGGFTGTGDFLPVDLSVPFKSSSLAFNGWTSEDLDLEGWEYVPPPNPHPLFHGFIQRQGGDTAFPSVHNGTGENKGFEVGCGKMRKADMKMSMMSERERGRRRQEDVMDSDNAFGGRRLVDDCENSLEHEGVVEFCLDAGWNSEAMLDLDSEDELDADLEFHDGNVFGHQRSPHEQRQLGWKKGGRGARHSFDEDDDEDGDLHDISNIPPRPHVNPTKNHPPPARLFAVAEEDEVVSEEIDDADSNALNGGTATETETEGETEGEGDEFEFDNVAARVPPTGALGGPGSGGENDTGSEDEDENFFADIHDITDILGDIEDGLGRHRRYPGPRRSQRPSRTETGDIKSNSRRAGLDLRPEDIEEFGLDEGRGYPYNSFDVDVEMGLGVGEGLRASSLEWEEGSDSGRRSGDGAGSRRGMVKGRPRTPYPKDEDEADEEKEQGLPEKTDAPTKKRARNHRRQWQTMLGSGKSSHSEGEGIEIALEVEKPKPRFIPTVKKVLLGGRGSKAQQRVPSAANETSDTPSYPGGKPRARTSSMYQRQPSPHSRAGLNAKTEDGESEGRPVGAAGSGLPLGIGFGYGSYSTSPPTSTPISKSSATGLLESSLLCQPLRFAPLPTIPSTPKSSDASSLPSRLPMKSLVASPPVFTPPVGAAVGPVRPRKHARSIPLRLDLEDGPPVDDYELAGYGQFGELNRSGRSTPNSLSSASYGSQSSASSCSSPGLLMSPRGSPSPTVGVASPPSFVTGSPIIRGRADELLQELTLPPSPHFSVDGTWEKATSASDGEEFTLAMDLPCRTKHPKKSYHLPSSLLLPKAGKTDSESTVGWDVDPGSSDPATSGPRRGIRKSVLADPGFFEPPAASCAAISGVEVEEGQVIECY